MRRFCLRCSLFLIPFLLWALSYLVLDPFQVVREHEDPAGPWCTTRNKNVFTTQLYLSNLANGPYDSFIFGNSRTLAFRVADWKQHLPPNSLPLVFDGHGEGLYGIHSKLSLLDRQGGPIRNALLLFCPGSTFTDMANPSTHLRIAHPAASGQGWLPFHWTFLKAWGSKGFFVKHIDYQLFGTIRPYMKGAIKAPKGPQFDPITAERTMPIEQEIFADPDRYYREHAAEFSGRDSTVAQFAPASITEQHEHALQEMQRILQKHGTDYRIVISPLYSQHRLDTTDRAVLNAIFGSDRVFDYSGINDITNERRNYIERSHFRFHVGERILSEIYSDPQERP